LSPTSKDMDLRAQTVKQDSDVRHLRSPPGYGARGCVTTWTATLAAWMDLLPLLSRLDLFRALDAETRAAIAEEAKVTRLRRGDVVFDVGDPAEELYVVRSGLVAIGIRSTDGRESMVALMEPGDVFGELGLFDGKGRSASARALEASEVVAIAYPPIREVLTERPELLWSVVALLAERLRVTDEALADSVFLDVTGRTAKRLIELSGGADEFTLPVTQEELAGLVGASRERVNKALSTFIRLGWLEQNERRYRITNRERLEGRAG
jgi:CRP/FNR family transcriptional regulator, cyclic AMP receptor protein